MAKKKFSAGLDSLFDDAFDTSGSGSVSEFSVRQSGPEQRRSSVKSFANDLDSLLHEALSESLDRMDAPDDPTLAGKSKSSSQQHPQHRSGLDTLIRQTLDVQDLTREEETGVRRLTVTVDRTKLEKLKTIARLENSYLKDLLVGLIDEYIREKGI
jgi:nucleoid-associated protein YgaU